MKIIPFAIILFACGLFLGLWYSIYQVSLLIFPPIVSCLLIAYLFYRILMDICRKFTFPGSTWLWRRHIENYYQKAFVVKTRKKLIVLSSLIQYIIKGDNVWMETISDADRREIAKTIMRILDLYEKQKIYHKPLNKRQKEMLNNFTEIQETLKATSLIQKNYGKLINFWDFLEEEEPTGALMVQDKKLCEILLEKTRKLERRLHDMVCERPFFPSMKRWLFENSFGTIDHMREELENRYKCERIKLGVGGTVVLDCVLISKKLDVQSMNAIPPLRGVLSTDKTPVNRDDIHSKRTQPTSLKTKSTGPTMILCCPNAGYYEYMCYESQWIDVYIKHGFNVFLWNYRGYGRSTGKPDPDALRKDGEAIVDYLRQTMGVEIIGCHGESMGGLVATHLARWKNIDFICADRTFESLFAVGNLVVGRSICVFYRLLTGWHDRLALDFLESKCYKVVTFDPKDEVIPFLCSLKHGITNKIVQKNLRIEEEPNKPSEKDGYGAFRLTFWAKKFIYSIKMEMFYNKVAKRLEQNYGPLTKDQLESYYKAFSRIFELFDSYSYLKHNFQVKKHRRMQSNVGFQSSTEMVPIKHFHSPQKAPRVHINMSPVSNCMDPDDSAFSVQSVTFQRENSNLLTVNEVKAPTRNSNQSNQSQNQSQSQCQTNEFDYRLSLTKNSYVNLFNDDCKRDTNMIIFLENIFSSFELFEFGGAQIETIMVIPESNRFEAFRHFIDTMEIWGSYLPLHQILKEDSRDTFYHQNKAIRKVNTFVRKIDQIVKCDKVKDQNKEPEPDPHRVLKSLILEDLEVIACISAILVKNVKSKDDRYNLRNNTFIPSAEGIELISKDLENPLLGSKSDCESKINHDYSSTVGHLIPLCCGHNGTLRPLELEIYEHYLKNARLI